MANSSELKSMRRLGGDKQPSAGAGHSGGSGGLVWCPAGPPDGAARTRRRRGRPRVGEPRRRPILAVVALVRSGCPDTFSVETSRSTHMLLMP